MSVSTDRVGEFLDGTKHNRRTLVTPEGVLLDIRVAGHGERLTAFFLDMLFMFAAIFCLYSLLIPLFIARANIPVGATLILFLAFIVRNLYFLHFELAWQGRTPGKRIVGLRVIDRRGGELSPSALIARNLTREVEIFLPLSLFLNLNPGAGFQHLALLGWVLVIVSLPFFNRDHLRAGDLIGGTQVIAMPKRALLEDLTITPRKKAEGYSFTHDQLAIYGAFELQVLEEFLRRPDTPATQHMLQEVVRKICRKIGWKEAVPEGDARRFLNDFYAAERASLERDQLFGRLRADKSATPKD